MTEPWYHGGRPGMRPGDIVQPPSVTGVVTFSELLKRYSVRIWLASGRHKDRRDRVYIGELPVATLAAAFYTLNPFVDDHGAVYQVEPIGDIEDDPADPDGYRCRSAEVISVVMADVGMRYISLHWPRDEWTQNRDLMLDMYEELEAVDESAN